MVQVEDCYCLSSLHDRVIYCFPSSQGIVLPDHPLSRCNCTLQYAPHDSSRTSSSIPSITKKLRLLHRVKDMWNTYPLLHNTWTGQTSLSSCGICSDTMQLKGSRISVKIVRKRLENKYTQTYKEVGPEYMLATSQPSQYSNNFDEWQGYYLWSPYVMTWQAYSKLPWMQHMSSEIELGHSRQVTMWYGSSSLTFDINYEPHLAASADQMLVWTCH